MGRVAIVGGGPGGLMAARLLEERMPGCEATLLEGSDRIGGKVRTDRFDSAPVHYEAGIAECYGYDLVGPDPLWDLVRELGIETVPLEGGTVVMDGKTLRGDAGIRQHLGERAFRAIEAFRRRASSMLPLEAWAEASWRYDAEHPWARRSCQEILDEVADPDARRYLRIAVHSDLATEPHLTSGLNGLENFLLDVPGYVRTYAFPGGMEELPRAIARRLRRTRLELGCRVTRVERSVGGGYRVRYRRRTGDAESVFDAVLVALPHDALRGVEWAGEPLRRAMSVHQARYDRPGHYLRVAALFREPFWRDRLHGSWFISDAFGGCCVYDEGLRRGERDFGVLGWLVAGADALTLGNLGDRELAQRVLGSLPGPLERTARELLLEARVHRWAAAVSGQPGGSPPRDPGAAHVPEPILHPGLILVGDYLLDSTLNGALDSARLATSLVREAGSPRRARTLRPEGVGV